MIWRRPNLRRFQHQRPEDIILISLENYIDEPLALTACGPLNPCSFTRSACVSRPTYVAARGLPACRIFVGDDSAVCSVLAPIPFTLSSTAAFAFALALRGLKIALPVGSS